jgi:uncharacterized protein YkwD
MRVAPLLLAGCALLAAPGSGGAQELPCASEDTLADAAALVLLQGTALGEADLTAALRAAGSDLPTVRALAGRPEQNRKVESWLRRLRAQSDAPLVCGAASSGDRRVVLAAARGGWLDVDGDHVRARVADGFGDAYLVARDAEDQLWRAGLEPGDLEMRASLPEHLARPITVQLMARGALGPRPVAVLEVGAASGKPVPSVPGADPMLPIQQRLETLRGQHRASPLRPNRLLAEEASAHAQRVCREERVGHELEAGADPEHRLAQRRVRARVVGEVVARARSTAAAFDALTSSPGHRMTMADRRFTDAGIGHATDRRGRTCLVVLLAAWPKLY